MRSWGPLDRLSVVLTNINQAHSSTKYRRYMNQESGSTQPKEKPLVSFGAKRQVQMGTIRSKAKADWGRSRTGPHHGLGVV